MKLVLEFAKSQSGSKSDFLSSCRSTRGLLFVTYHKSGTTPLWPFFVLIESCSGALDGSEGKV